MNRKQDRGLVISATAGVMFVFCLIGGLLSCIIPIIGAGIFGFAVSYSISRYTDVGMGSLVQSCSVIGITFGSALINLSFFGSKIGFITVLIIPLIGFLLGDFTGRIVKRKDKKAVLK